MTNYYTLYLPWLYISIHCVDVNSEGFYFVTFDFDPDVIKTMDPDETMVWLGAFPLKGPRVTIHFLHIKAGYNG